jgi:hypothetical protein
MIGFSPGESEWKSSASLIRDLRPHMQVCAPCPFRADCIALVKPAQARFDGVAGGRIWANGVVICQLSVVADDELIEPELRASCGTEAGARDHNRHGERACSICLRVAREATARRGEQRAKEQDQQVPGQLQLEIFTAA